MNDLSVYDRMAVPEQFIAAMGRHILRSGMFGCETEDQGCVLALECAARKMPPLSLSQRFHLIKGKLSMKADAMLAGLIQVGGKYEVDCHTADKATITITRDRKKHTFSLSWEEAQAEPFVYDGKESDVIKILAAGNAPKIKAKYATPRSRMQMLWARVVSDGVRVMAPDVVAGYYTPEETGDVVEAESPQARSLTATGPTMAEVADSAPAAKALSKPKPPVKPELTPPAAAKPTPEIEAEAERTIQQTVQQEADAATAEAMQDHSSDGRATPRQVEIVKTLFQEIGMTTDQLSTLLGKVGAKRVQHLSVDHCDQLIAVMEKAKAKRQEESAKN